MAERIRFNERVLLLGTLRFGLGENESFYNKPMSWFVFSHKLYCDGNTPAVLIMMCSTGYMPKFESQTFDILLSKPSHSRGCLIVQQQGQPPPPCWSLGMLEIRILSLDRRRLNYSLEEALNSTDKSKILHRRKLCVLYLLGINTVCDFPELPEGEEWQTRLPPQRIATRDFSTVSIYEK